MNSRVDCIFSINTGRSGSEYLYRLFQHVENCTSTHHPDPIGNMESMRKFLRGKRGAMESVADEKAKIILGGLPHTVYVETNHTFIKGFGWLIPRRLAKCRIGVVVLTRDSEKIVDSLLRIGCSPLEPLGRDWIMTPEKSKHEVEPPRLGCLSPKWSYSLGRISNVIVKFTNKLGRRFDSNFEFELDWLLRYEKAALAWYVEETIRMGEIYETEFPDLTYFHVTVDELNDPAKVLEMLTHFGLRAKASISSVLGTPTNLFSNRDRTKPAQRA